MEDGDLLQSLLELAREAGLEIRSVGGRATPETDLVTTSAVVRVRDQVWIVLSTADPVESQMAVLARALVDHAGDWLDSHFVAPAVRECLDALDPPG